MRTERPEQQKPQIKVCPYWARYAEGPNGWIIAHCSYNACQKMEQSGRVWEGPQRAKRCLVGYNKKVALIRPSLIVLNTLSLQEIQPPIAEVDEMSSETWSNTVDVFRSHVSRWSGDPTGKDLEQLYGSITGGIFNQPFYKFGA